MNVEMFYEYCMAKKGVTEGFPFGENVLVFKVMEKIFTLSDINSSPFRVNLKCDPNWALELREEHKDIIPGYHMNKAHWNTVICEGNLNEHLIKQLIDHSYQLVSDSLNKKTKAIFDQL